MGTVTETVTTLRNHTHPNIFLQLYKHLGYFGLSYCLNHSNSSMITDQFTILHFLSKMMCMQSQALEVMIFFELLKNDLIGVHYK